jgi:hypothetical protein
MAMAIETSIIANLRVKTANTSDVYYTTPIGQEGERYCDVTDLTSVDNVGTLLVSTSGLRFKRIYDADFVNATWFGAKGDGINDDYQAI